MKRTSALCVILLIGALAGPARAGSVYEVTCPEPGCGYKTSFDMFGGMSFDQVQGFCGGCRKPVKITWERDQDEKKPKPKAEFRDPATGEVRRLYTCPECGGAFAEIVKIEDFRHCPKCGKAGLKHTLNLLYD